MREEQSYYSEIMSLLRKFYGKDLQKLGTKVVGEQEFFQRYAWQAAKRMIVGKLQGSAKTWQAAARENMKGGIIYAALRNEMAGSVGERVRELVQYNATLIRSLPSEVASQVAEHIANQAREGKRATASIPGLLAHVARARARLIARTETSKATTALTRARAEELDLQWYVWRSSLDQRVRLSHRRMNDVIFNWDQPPAPEKLVGEKSTAGHYHAGNIWNCRCYPEPLLRLDQVQWPHKLYIDGTIRSVPLVYFRKLNNRKNDLGIAA